MKESSTTLCPTSYIYSHRVASSYVKLTLDTIANWNARRRQGNPASRTPLAPRDNPFNSSPPRNLHIPEEIERPDQAPSSESSLSMGHPSNDAPWRRKFFEE